MWETLLVVAVSTVVDVLELWADGWVLDWETGPAVDKVKPTDPVNVLIDEGTLDGTDSLLDPEVSSGRNSDDEDDGASIPIDEPTGYGATGMSAREEADGL